MVLTSDETMDEYMRYSRGDNNSDDDDDDDDDDDLPF